jgi:hypothetical protein
MEDGAGSTACPISIILVTGGLRQELSREFNSVTGGGKTPSYACKTVKLQIR